MLRGFRQAADFFKHILTSHLAGSGNRLSGNQLRQSRCAGHRRHATLGSKADLDKLSGGASGCEFQNIAAGRVFDLDPSVCIGDLAGVAGILKVVENLRGIHPWHCK